MLTETQIRKARPRATPYRLADDRGLSLLVTPNGARWWRFRYSFAGREKQLSLGVYPDVSLKRAREKRDECRQAVADGIDPSVRRRAEKLAQADTFEGLAREWLATQVKKLAPSTFAKAEWTFETLLFPWIGSRPIASVTPREVLTTLRRIESRGTHETAHRAKQRAGQVFRYAVATGRAERDITADLRGALTPVTSQRFAAITEPRRIGDLLRAIDGYQGQPTVMYALRLAPLVFVRPGELRRAEWTEFDLDTAEWRIPAERMKMRERHIVPLSSQAMAILRELRPFTGDGRLVFPSLRTRLRPISENTLNAALRRLGFSKDEMTSHGFRALASTRLNEMGYQPDVIELQLAHAPRDKVRAAYNRAERLNDRRTMMQAWSDYLDALRAGASVTAIRRAR